MNGDKLIMIVSVNDLKVLFRVEFPLPMYFLHRSMIVILGKIHLSFKPLSI